MLTQSAAKKRDRWLERESAGHGFHQMAVQAPISSASRRGGNVGSNPLQAANFNVAHCLRGISIFAHGNFQWWSLMAVAIDSSPTFGEDLCSAMT
jgi:hypothetical protein